ncbi:MAG: alpha/beta fold hydrolase [Myxococcaceae bacterium]|nr:alpha/beta fold hydrolase [Myxococcaceae bacterium]
MRRWVWAAIALAVAGLTAAIGVTVRDVERVLHPPRKSAPVNSTQWPFEAITLETRDGVKLAAWYLPSTNGAAVVLAHGHGENRSQMLPEAHVLASRGFGVLLFDWRAHGDSEGRLSTRGDRERYDLFAAIDWVSQQADVVPGRLGVLGYSRGATVGLEVTACDPRVGAVVAEASVTSMRESLDHDFSRFGKLSQVAARMWVKRVRHIDVDSVRPIEHIGHISPRPLLLVHGTLDPSVPAYMGTLLYLTAESPKQLWLVGGAGHGGFVRHVGPEYATHLASFFEGALLGRTTPERASTAHGRL